MVLRCRHDRRTEHGDEKQTRLGLALALGVLLWATGAGAAETPYQQGLGQLECVTLLIENLDADVRSLGLSEDQLRNVLLVATRAKLPRLLGRVVSQRPVSDRDHGPQRQVGILRCDQRLRSS
jgi:hypothetical protein